MRKIPTFFWEYKGHKPPPTDINEYRLTVEGEVSSPLSLSLADLDSLLPKVEVDRRFYCVNGWSLASLWVGYTLSSLLDIVQPKPNAPYLRATSLGGYEDTTEIIHLLRGDALLVTHKDGEPLSPERGHPVRLMIFNMYQFKGVKALAQIEIVTEYRPGTWQKVGYRSAVIQPYPHLAIDLGEDLLPENDILDQSALTE